MCFWLKGENKLLEIKLSANLKICGLGISTKKRVHYIGVGNITHSIHVRYIYLYMYFTTQQNVGKYTSPMDGIGNDPCNSGNLSSAGWQKFVPVDFIGIQKLLGVLVPWFAEMYVTCREFGEVCWRLMYLFLFEFSCLVNRSESKENMFLHTFRQDQSRWNVGYEFT